MLEFGEDLFDRVEVGAVGRQEDEVSAPGPDGGARRLALVAAEIVQDDDVARRKRWGQNALNVEPEELPVDRPIDDPGRVDAVMTPPQSEQAKPVAALPMAVAEPETS